MGPGPTSEEAGASDDVTCCLKGYICTRATFSLHVSISYLRSFTILILAFYTQTHLGLWIPFRLFAHLHISYCTPYALRSCIFVCFLSLEFAKQTVSGTPNWHKGLEHKMAKTMFETQGGQKTEKRWNR